MEKVLIPGRLIVADIVALVFILVVPALSHLTAVPFYLVDPMRLAALGVLLATRDWKNSFVLAILLPVFSMLISGHPVFPKCLLISLELGVNVLLLEGLFRLMGQRWAVRPGIAAGAAAFFSIVLSKALYYLLKLAVISAGLLQMSLVSTSLWIQLIVSLGISLVFAFVVSRTTYTPPRRE